MTRGLPSDESKREVEEEIEKIKSMAFTIAKDIVKKYKDEIRTFVEDYLIHSETMVRKEIVTTLKDMGVEAGKFYQPMCDALKNDLGYIT